MTWVSNGEDIEVQVSPMFEGMDPDGNLTFGTQVFITSHFKFQLIMNPKKNKNQKNIDDFFAALESRL